MVSAEFVSEPLAAAHGITDFDSGRPELDEWLKRTALHAQANRTARTFVWHRGDGVVLAWFSLAATAVRRDDVPARTGRGSPETIPALLLARLAVDRSMQGRGVGADVLGDAMRRAVAATEQIGARLLVVDAIDERAAGFYERYGFARIPGQLRLAQKISDIAAAIKAAASPRA